MAGPVIPGIAAVLLYLVAAGELGRRMFQRRTAGVITLPLVVLAALALGGHGMALHRAILAPGGFNLGFFHAFSLLCWVVAALSLAVGAARSMDNLVLVFFPLAALALLLELALPSTNIIADDVTAGLKAHILLSVAAYALLTTGAAQALVLAFQEARLRRRRPAPVMNVLPPMQILEKLLAQTLAAGFFLLSLSLVSGLAFMHDILEQRLTHKVVLSVLAWMIFAVVLWGRWARGWRGRRLTHWALGGCASLLLAYFGSKFVLELILRQHAV